MIIKEIKKRIETSDHPILRSLHQGTGFKVLAMVFKEGMVLKEHKAHIRSKLTVLEGCVHYEEAGKLTGALNLNSTMKSKYPLRSFTR